MENNSNGSVYMDGKNEADSMYDSMHNVSYAQVLQRGKSIEASTPNNNLVDPNRNIETPNFGSDLSAVSQNDTLSDFQMNTCHRSMDCSSSDCIGALENGACNGCPNCIGTSDTTLEQYETANTASTASETQESSQDLLCNDETKISSSMSTVKSPNEGDGYSSDLSSEEGSCEEEEESEGTSDMDYAHALKWQLRKVNPELPPTVTVLDVPGGGKVYLVGTAHFSVESQEDVAKTIRSTLPDVVMVELCKSRVNILSLDEETILEESKNMNLQKIRTAIQQNGFMQGVLYLLLLNMSAHLTKQLGMAPGGEFRTAFAEAQKIPGCMIHLGDRPIHITLQRALATLSLWQKIRIGYYMLTSKEPISKQEVERCKQRDLLEETLAEMTGEFPELSKVFVQERDVYLAYSLQMASTPMPSHVSPSGVNSTVVVGVVGIGHVPGIVANWGKVDEKDIPPITRIPPASSSSRILLKVFRYSVYGLVLYCGYRIIPKQLVNKPIGLVRHWLPSFSDYRFRV